MTVALAKAGPPQWRVGQPFPTWIPGQFAWLSPTQVDRLLEIHGSPEQAETALDKLATNRLVRNPEALLLLHLDNPAAYRLWAEEEQSYISPTDRRIRAQRADQAATRAETHRHAQTEQAKAAVREHPPTTLPAGIWNKLHDEEGHETDQGNESS
jgi:hypothetical protein